MSSSIIHVTGTTLKRWCKVSKVQCDAPLQELRQFYLKAIHEDFMTIYTFVLNDVSQYLLRGKPLHRLTTAEELYRTHIVASSGEHGTFDGDLIFVGSHLSCNLVIKDIPQFALIIATLPGINRILIVDPGTACGYTVGNIHSKPKRRKLSVFQITDTISVTIHNTILTIFAK